MTTTPARLGEIRFRLETAANEAIADPVTYWANAAAKKIKAWDVDTSQLKKASEDDPHLQTHVGGDPARLQLGKSGALPFTCFLSGLEVAAADGITVLQDELGLLLKGALGGESLATSPLVATGNTGIGATTPIQVDNPSRLVAR